jgi:sugar lactone lactonase YvrE
MNLKIFYDPLINYDDGSIMGIQLVIEHKDKYLSIWDIQNNKFYYYDEETGEQAVLDMTKQESLNKINDLIKKVLE